MNHFASSDEFRQRLRRADARAAARVRRSDGGPGRRAFAGQFRRRARLARRARDWVRPGGALYGISVVDGTTGADFGLRPAMTLAHAPDRGQPRRARASASATRRPGHVPRTCPSAWPRSATATAIRARARRHAGAGQRPARADHRSRVDGPDDDRPARRSPTRKPGDPVVLWGDGPAGRRRSPPAAGTIGYELVCSITRRVRFVEALSIRSRFHPAPFRRVHTRLAQAAR